MAKRNQTINDDGAKMPELERNVSLKPYNSFGLEATAAHLAIIQSIADLKAALATSIRPLHILGDGSNILLKGDLPGLVLKNEIRHREIISETGKEVIVALGGGENWHDVVLWALQQNLGGIENLSLIPGTVGAAPMQNIGAYGVELKDTFVKLEAFHLNEKNLKTFHKDEVEFGYRTSIFKKSLKGKVFIAKVYLKLQKPPHTLHTEYGAIQQVLQCANIEKPTIRDVSNAVIKIRKSKLPDPAKIGNSGSFFKNPVIEKSHFLKLQRQHPGIVHYPLADGGVKVPAGWLIEQCGWKGKRLGNTGCHSQQALVLVNYGNATGEEIWNLAKAIQSSVYQKFGIRLSPEVNILG